MYDRRHASRHREVDKQAMHKVTEELWVRSVSTQTICRRHKLGVLQKGQSCTSILGGTISALTELGGCFVQE